MFITRVRIVQVGTGTPAAPQPITPVVFRTGPAGTVVERVADAMALVPAGQRPAQADWWQYALQWEVTAHTVPTVRGVLPYTLADKTVPLVVDGDFWLTEAQRLAGTPPPVRNTFVFVFSARPRDYAATLRATVDDWLMRVTFGGWSGDLRDPVLASRASRAPADDPRGLVAALASADGAPRTLNAVWRPSL